MKRMEPSPSQDFSWTLMASSTAQLLNGREWDSNVPENLNYKDLQRTGSSALGLHWFTLSQMELSKVSPGHWLSWGVVIPH